MHEFRNVLVGGYTPFLLEPLALAIWAVRGTATSFVRAANPPMLITEESAPVITLEMTALAEKIDEKNISRAANIDISGH